MSRLEAYNSRWCYQYSYHLRFTAQVSEARVILHVMMAGNQLYLSTVAFTLRNKTTVHVTKSSRTKALRGSQTVWYATL